MMFPGRIYSFDCSKNDIPVKGVLIEGYPTVYWFPSVTSASLNAGNSSRSGPIQYLGDRTVEEIQDFLLSKYDDIYSQIDPI